MGDFLEQMARSTDISVKELLNVSVLEPLVLEEENIVSILKKVFGARSKTGIRILATTSLRRDK